jgi:hypothetical protein
VIGLIEGWGVGNEVVGFVVVGFEVVGASEGVVVGVVG